MALKHSNIKAYGYLLERTQRKIRQSFQKELLAQKTDITVDQWIILDRLSRTNGLSQNEIADTTLKDAPTVTRIIDLLVKKKLVKRETDPNDRRRFNILLTDAGKKKVETVNPIIMEMRKKGWESLTDDDYSTMMRILDTIYKNFSQ